MWKQPLLFGLWAGNRGSHKSKFIPNNKAKQIWKDSHTWRWLCGAICFWNANMISKKEKKMLKPVSHCVDNTWKMAFEVEFWTKFKTFSRVLTFLSWVSEPCSWVAGILNVWKICPTSFLSFYSQNSCGHLKQFWTFLNFVSVFCVFSGSSTVAAQLDNTLRHHYWFSVNERTIRA